MCRLETAGSRRNPLFFALLRRSSWFTIRVYNFPLCYTRIITHTAESLVSTRLDTLTHCRGRFRISREKKDLTFAAKSAPKPTHNFPRNIHFLITTIANVTRRTKTAKTKQVVTAHCDRYRRPRKNFVEQHKQEEKHVSLPRDGLCQSTQACDQPTIREFRESDNDDFGKVRASVREFRLLWYWCHLSHMAPTPAKPVLPLYCCCWFTLRD